MAELFTSKYALLWDLALTAALFFPVRQIIWVLSVRRAERDGIEDEERRARLKRRAGVTAALLAFVFAYAYTRTMFKG
jgi:hypothetical protein